MFVVLCHSNPKKLMHFLSQNFTCFKIHSQRAKPYTLTHIASLKRVKTFNKYKNHG